MLFLTLLDVFALRPGRATIRMLMRTTIVLLLAALAAPLLMQAAKPTIAFVGLVVTLQPKFKTRPLILKYKLKNHANLIPG